MATGTISLLPPPRLCPNGELSPVIDPPLRDLAPFPGAGVVEEWDHFESAPSDHHFSDVLRKQAEEVALADSRVKGLLANKRHIAIGASLREEGDAKGAATSPASLVFVVYNYDDNIALEVVLDRNGRTVSRVDQTRTQPPPVQQEIARAVELARRDSKLAAQPLQDLEANAILVSPSDPSDPHYGHRIFDVRFFCPNERLPRQMAMVDLSTDTVLRAGTGCGDELKRGGQS